MSNDQTIQVGEDIADALDQIRAADGPIRLELCADSCKWGNVFDLLTISNAMKNHPHRTTAVATDCVSLIPFVGADVVEIAWGAAVFIKPPTILTAGDCSEMRRTEETLQKLSRVVSRQFAKWPKIKELFDGGGEHYFDAYDFKQLTKGENHG